MGAGIQTNQISLAAWPFPNVRFADQMKVQQTLGMKGPELLTADNTAEVKAANLTSTLILTPLPEVAPFQMGIGSVEADWKIVKAGMEVTLKHAADNKLPRVICFTGCVEAGKEQSAAGNEMKDLCVARLLELNEIAERVGFKGKICLEHLNNHEFKGEGGDMMGHPGYIGHDIHYVAEIVKEANRQGANSVALLYDIYHVRITNPGQEYTALQQYHKDGIVGHFHIAQEPGRLEIHRDGTIDVPRTAGILHELGYGDTVCIEPRAHADITSASELEKRLIPQIALLTGK